MKHIRYYAIGHSYLLHGPFAGWQMKGVWGMAASEPSLDYFHLFQDHLREGVDCRLEAVAENQADYERRCVEGATRADYEQSPEYAHMVEVIRTFKPNLISLFLGEGNTVAKDDESMVRFFTVLYEMIAREKREETVVVCPCMKGSLYELMKPLAEQYGFLPVDMSFLHEKKGYENPYYAYRAYPEYDKRRAEGGVEFRTHPGDLGHAEIARRMWRAVAEAISRQIPEGDLAEPYEWKQYVHSEALPVYRIQTTPEMYVQYDGFNVRQQGDCVTFGSAPDTGASLRVEGAYILPECNRFYVEMAVDGAMGGERLVLALDLKGRTVTLETTIPDAEMHRYEFDLSDVKERIVSFRVTPDLKDCVVTVRALEFLK